jgi:hypothetical protein
MMTRPQPVLALTVLLLAGCASSSSSSAVSTSTLTVAAVTTSPTTRPSPKPTARTAPATPARYPSCTVGQLTLDYYGKTSRHGNDFALIRIRDTATQPCALTGPIALVGIGSGGTTDTPTLTYAVTNRIVLTPNAARVSVTGTPPPGEVVADLSLAADYRDDPTSANALCNRQGVTPSSWRLTFPDGSTVVANTALTPTPGTTGSSGLVTCRGHLNPAGPVTREPV